MTPPLLPTLEELLRQGGNKTDAARALHLNRQALYHRIERLEQILGADLGDPDDVLGLHLALRASRYMGMPRSPGRGGSLGVD